MELVFFLQQFQIFKLVLYNALVYFKMIYRHDELSPNVLGQVGLITLTVQDVELVHRYLLVFLLAQFKILSYIWQLLLLLYPFNI